jgi:hypothetical protein
VIALLKQKKDRTSQNPKNSDRALSLQMFPIGSAIATIVFCGASSLSFITNF